MSEPFTYCKICGCPLFEDEVASPCGQCGETPLCDHCEIDRSCCGALQNEQVHCDFCHKSRRAFIRVTKHGEPIAIIPEGPQDGWHMSVSSTQTVRGGHVLFTARLRIECPGHAEAE